jgi:hypothetical protein
MTSKEKLAQNVKNWLQMDKEIKIIQKELKDRKKKKNDYRSSHLQRLYKRNFQSEDRFWIE